MKKLWFLEQQIIKGSNGVRKTKRNTPPLWKQRSKVMVREVTLVSLALFMVFFFAGAAESFGNPLTIKADSTRWATWEDGEHIFGLSPAYDECWNRAKDLNGQTVCLQAEFKRNMNSTNTTAKQIENLNMTEKQRVYFATFVKHAYAAYEAGVEFASDPTLESPYAVLAMKAVITKSIDDSISFFHLLQSGKQ